MWGPVFNLTFLKEVLTLQNFIVNDVSTVYFIVFLLLLLSEMYSCYFLNILYSYVEGMKTKKLGCKTFVLSL